MSVMVVLTLQRLFPQVRMFPPLLSPFHALVFLFSTRSVSFTDGSATSGVGRCASSVFMRFGSRERELSQFVGVGSILMAELFALRMALRFVLSFFQPSLVLLFLFSLTLR